VINLKNNNLDDSTYISFIEIAFELVGLIPPYSSKYSKRTFTQQQLFVLLILKQKLRLSYERLIDDLKTRTNILLMLGLSKLPAPSTLRMFARRVKPIFVELLIGNCIKLAKKRKLKLGIDSTGFELKDGSFYYARRAGLSTTYKNYLKLSISADLDKQVVVATKVRKKKSNDTIDFLELAKESSKHKEIKSIAADKGYDSEKNHKFVIRTLKAKSLIAQRDFGSKRIQRNRRFRNKAKKEFDEKEYHQRSKVETIFYVIKHLFGAIVHAKKWLMQKKEILFRVLAYNIHRLVILRI